MVKGHPQLISKANGILKILFSQNLVTEQDLDIYWKQIHSSDLETRNCLLSVLQEILWEFSEREIYFILHKFEEKV